MTVKCENAGKKRCCEGREALCVWCGLLLCMAHHAGHRCRQMLLRSVRRGEGFLGTGGSEAPEGFVEVGLGLELARPPWRRG